MNRFLPVLFLFIFPFFLHAGNGDRFLPKDSASVKDTVKIHSPKRAAIYSMVLPGLGQAYNGRKSWWKIPVVYAGFGGLGYGFAWNQGYYKDYRNALRMRYDDDPATIDDYPQYSDNDLVTLKNYYQRYRDLCIVGMAALYTLQVLDATVDAHLYNFDVSDNLSLRVQPSLSPAPTGMACGIGIQIGYR